MHDCKNLDEYLQRYGNLLGKQAEERLQPLHVPGRDALPEFNTLRPLIPAQAHVCAAGVKELTDNNSLWVCADMGTGKTMMGATTADTVMGDKYRNLIFCPGHLVHKWEREIQETIPGAMVLQLDSWKQLTKMKRDRVGKEWVIVGRDRAKLGAEWRPAIETRKVPAKEDAPPSAVAVCPKCKGDQRLKDETPIPIKRFSSAQRRCNCMTNKWVWVKGADGVVRHSLEQVECGEQLWQFVGGQQGRLDRWAPARYIHKKMRGFFDVLILDEAHEEKSEDSEQAVAAGSLGAACKKSILMTGTLIGGYANHVRPLLFRFSPRSLVDEGLTWGESSKFTRIYGRVEKTVYESDRGGRSSGRMGRRGSSGYRETEKPKPGIMPALFGRHLIGQCVYLSLDEVAQNLPKYTEIPVAVDMDPEQAGEYARVSQELVETNKQLLIRGDKSLLGAMVQTLLAWPDYPYGWDWVGYWRGDKDNPEERKFIPVVAPANYPEHLLMPKERKLIEIIKEEKAAGRQCWVFVQYTSTHDVQGRIVDILNKSGISALPLRADAVATTKREEWIAKNGKKYDVIVSHPKPVETGLDLFDKGGGHNFSTLIFYETGYVTNTLRQASKRSWRIGQKLPCRVYFLFYDQSAQAAAMQLMGSKLAAAQAIEGKFSTEGLVAMGGDDVDVQLALAKSLDSILPGETARVWKQLDSVSFEPPERVPAEMAYKPDSLFEIGDDDELFKDTLLEDLDDVLAEPVAEVKAEHAAKKKKKQEPVSGYLDFDFLDEEDDDLFPVAVGGGDSLTDEE